jgi:hypothetical protein
MSVFNSTLESIRCQSNKMQQARQYRHLITISQKLLGLVCTQLGQIAFISTATRRNLTDQDNAELILELDSDTHSLEDEDISAQSNSDSDSNTGDTTDTNFTQWTYSTNC